MNRKEVLWELLRKKGLSNDEIEGKIKEKQKEVGGLLTEEGALTIIANELGTKEEQETAKIILETKKKELQEVVKSSLRILEDDILFLRDFDASLSSEISNSLERMKSRYMFALEKIVREDESGYSDLEDIQASVNEVRLQQYRKAAKFKLGETKKKLKDAFWIRDQFLLQKNDEIEKQIYEADSLSKDTTRIEEAINLYREQINALSRVAGVFQQERRQTRFDIPVKMLLWCIPIIIGILVSGRFDNKTNSAIIVIVLLSVLLSYFLIGSKWFDRTLNRSRILLIIFVLFTTAVILMLYFYRSISNYFHANAKSILLYLSFLVLTIFLLAFENMRKIKEFLAKRKLLVVIPTISKNFSPGDTIVIPYSLENRSSNVITDIRVAILAPGLVVSKGEDILHRSISGKSAENGELTFLQVPREAVPGEYIVELEWSFYIKSEEYTKTNRVEVSIILYDQSKRI